MQLVMIRGVTEIPIWQQELSCFWIAERMERQCLRQDRKKNRMLSSWNCSFLKTVVPFGILLSEIKTGNKYMV